MLPPRYGSSAEESKTPSETEEKPKTKPVRKRKQNKDGEDERVPLGRGKKDDTDENDSDDLDGLQDLLQLDGDGVPKKKPSTKSKSSGASKRPASSKGSRKKDWIIIACFQKNSC